MPGRLLRAAFVFVAVPLATTKTLADGFSQLPPRIIPSKSVVLELLPGQLGLLWRLDPICAAKLVGNASESGNIGALVLSPDVKPQCLLTATDAEHMRKGSGLQSEESGTHKVIILRALALKQKGANLIRVDQNFGGSFTLVRYAVVTMVYDRKPRTLLLVRELLPASLVGDNAALEYGNARRY